MLKRGLLIGGATAVAAATLLVTLMVGPSTAPVREHRASPPGQADLPIGSGPPRGDLDDSLPVLGSSHGQYAFQHGDRWTYLRFTEVTPLPDGVIDVVQPRARTHSSPSRVLQMTADEATFVAPDNQPRQGDFRGNVVLTLYESKDGSPVDFETDRDVRTVVYLDTANFDLELGQIDSAGPVHLAGAAVDFHGTGLSLNYNPRRERLERLEIFKGKSLRFRAQSAEKSEPQPQAQPQTEAVPQPPDAPDASPEDPTPAAASGVRGRPDASQDGKDSENPDVTEDLDAAPPVQFYRARFADNVHVHAPGDADTAEDDVTMTGDALTALFSFDRSGDDSPEEQPDSAAPRDDPSASQPVEMTAQASPARPATPDDSASSADPSRRALMTPRDDDVVITWTGRLLVEPQAETPADLAGPDDVLLGLEGQSVHIRTGRDDSIVARRVDYLISSRRVRAFAGEDDAVVLASPHLGLLTGRQLLIDQAAATGHVLGPGWLRGADDAPTDTTLAGDLEVTWADRLDLTFFTAPPGSDSAATSAAADIRLRGLRTATFQGNAVASHPQFNLRGDELTIRVSEPADGRSQTIEHIDATGRVTLAARSLDDEEQIDVRSDELSIALAADAAGEPYPTRIVARGDVEALQPTLELRAQHLDITPALAEHRDDETNDALAQAEQDAVPPQEEPQVQSPTLAIAHMLATDDVRVRLLDRDLTLLGDRLVVDTPADRIDLFGGEHRHARVIQPDGTLTGDHIVVGQTSQTVRVAGPGTIDLHALPDDPDGALHVTWRTAMHFDNRLGVAEFVDDVVATTESATDRSRLTASHLQLDFAPSAEAAAEDESAAPGDAASQRLRTATARDDAIFTAHTFAPGTPDRFLTHVHLEGPVMTFDRRGNVQQLQVLGEGRMLLIDRRPARVQPTAADAPAPGISGRGATLFLWTDTLTLDVARSDMHITGDVKMTHRPDTPAAPIHFDAQRLFVDFQPGESASDVQPADTASSSPWLHDDMAGLTIAQIQAHDNVLITRSPHHVIADHLHYTADDQTVVLQADPGHIVEITEVGRPVPITGRTITWNLATNSFDINQPVRTVIPLQR